MCNITKNIPQVGAKIMYIYSPKYHTIVTIYEKYIPQLGAKINIFVCHELVCSLYPEILKNTHSLPWRLLGVTLKVAGFQPSTVRQSIGKMKISNTGGNFLFQFGPWNAQFSRVFVYSLEYIILTNRRQHFNNKKHLQENDSADNSNALVFFQNNIRDKQTSQRYKNVFDSNDQVCMPSLVFLVYIY